MGEVRSTREQLFAKVRIKPDADTINFIQDTLVPYMSKAVKTAEGNSRNHGVLSVKTANSSEASRVLDTSIRNNYLRWVQAGMPGRFVDFMAQRWAPQGVSNDPNNLNANWPTNVRRSLQQQMTPDQYNRLRAMRVAMATTGEDTTV